MISCFDNVIKPFEEMTDSDYAKLGLKVGLEIHQQLLTEKKLFCRCPAGRYSDEYNAEILRHMRPTLSEMGEYDGTALMEFKTKKEIIYQINKETVCTYEMDDCPPFPINENALDIALEITMLLECNLVDEIHIARKQYLDGSIPTGFQRTTILGVDGHIPYNKKRIGIVQLGLEEDACREVRDEGHFRTYRTDRLGMPLIEVVTCPDMHTPHEAMEVGQLIRRLTRSTGKVRSGMGAARQDVNISINGATRIEIKGVSKLRYLPRLIYHEVMRQYHLLRIRDMLRDRGLKAETYRVRSENITQNLLHTDFYPIREALKLNAEVACVVLPKFEGILNQCTQTGRTLAREFSDRIRVIACIDSSPNFIHNGQDGETLSQNEWEKIRILLQASPSDALTVVWGKSPDVKTAIGEIKIRAKEAMAGVPSETRQALSDFTNGFERILPGPSRMYPDTDLPPKVIKKGRMNDVRNTLKPTPWKKSEKYRKHGVADLDADLLSYSKYEELFREVSGRFPKLSRNIGHFVVAGLKQLKRENYRIDEIQIEFLSELFTGLDSKNYTSDILVNIAREWLRLLPKYQNVDDFFRPYLENSVIEKCSEIIEDIVKSNPEPITQNIESMHRYWMGRIMKRYYGVIDGEKLAVELNDYLKSNYNE